MKNLRINYYLILLMLITTPLYAEIPWSCSPLVYCKGVPGKLDDCQGDGVPRGVFEKSPPNKAYGNHSYLLKRAWLSVTAEVSHPTSHVIIYGKAHCSYSDTIDNKLVQFDFSTTKNTQGPNYSGVNGEWTRMELQNKLVGMECDPVGHLCEFRRPST